MLIVLKRKDTLYEFYDVGKLEYLYSIPFQQNIHASASHIFKILPNSIESAVGSCCKNGWETGWRI